MAQGNLEVKLGQSQRREDKKQEDQSRKEEKKMQMREKVEKSQNTLCFPNDLWPRRVEKYAR